MSNMQAIELDINEAKRRIELGNALNRLKGNSDFNMLIGHHYFIEHAARTTSLLASPSMQSPQNQALLFGDLRAISELQQFLNMITVEANKCVEALSEMEEARDLIAAGDEE